MSGGGHSRTVRYLAAATPDLGRAGGNGESGSGDPSIYGPRILHNLL